MKQTTTRTMMHRTAAFVAGAALALLTAAGAAHAQGTNAFTYQGLITNGGAALTTPADVQFSLFDALSGGNQIGATVTVANVTPDAQGRVTVPVDFGSAAFTGGARFLQIAVRSPAGAGAFTTLTPRQPMTPAPYATYAANAGNTFWQANGTAISNTNSGFVGVGRSTRVTGAEVFGIFSTTANSFGGMYVQCNGANSRPFYGYSKNGTADAFHSLNAAGDWVLNVDNIDRLTVTTTGDVGIGITVPTARLAVATDANLAINADANGFNGVGVNGTGNNAGLKGTSGTTFGVGVYGISTATSNGGGNGIPAGVRGDASFPGVAGGAFFNPSGTALYAQTGGNSNQQFAGFFAGRVQVNGNFVVSGGSKNFMIDHPLDPENKTLSHAAIETDALMNLYSGNVTTDASGVAIVTLPAWFEALNTEFRYQLTVLDSGNSEEFVQAKVARKIEGNRFTIRTSRPGTEVSWQVTAVRHDPAARVYALQVEKNKAENERGKYLVPAAFGAGAEQGISPFSGRQ